MRSMEWASVRTDAVVGQEGVQTPRPAPSGQASYHSLEAFAVFEAASLVAIRRYLMIAGTLVFKFTSVEHASDVV